MTASIRIAPAAGMTALAASFMILPYPALGEGMNPNKLAPQPAGIVAAGPMLSAGHAYAFGAGDRLKITFYDREDLSGVYRVRTDGRVSMPFIGAISVSGKSLGQLEQEIAASFKKMTKRTTYVNIEAVERRPFYVVGYVNKPGAYPFVPGMTVLHAIAVAGGVYRTAPSAGVNINVSRETWKRNSATESLKRSLARLSRLHAERDGLTTIAPLKRLVALVGADHAAVLLASEKRIFEQNRRGFIQRSEDLARAEKFAQDEINAYRDEFKFVKEQEGLHKIELRDTEKLAKRGLTRRSRVYSKRYQISNLKGKASEVTAAIARAERAFAKTKRDRSMLVLDKQRRIEIEIKTVEDEVEKFVLAVRASDDVIEQITGMAPSMVMNASASQAIRFKIMRWNTGVYKIVDSAELSRLLPGDVVRVSPGAAQIRSVLPPRLPAAQPQEVNLITKAGLRAKRESPEKIKAYLQQSTKELRKMLQIQRDQLEKEKRDHKTEVKDWISQVNEMERKKAAVASELKMFKASIDKLEKQQAVTKEMVTVTSPDNGLAAKLVELRTETLQKVLNERDPGRRMALALQSELDRIGCSPKYIDGIWGPESKSALKRFNKTAKLSLKVNRPTKAAINALMLQKSLVCEARTASADSKVETK